ncbi:hypothetical protein [Rothia aeria]|uniref:hypothetical protein n=1 Tax=Rothia aeria TaxID=172042 RepID=UPI00254D4C51|nr:hypothetical protein [Rothia aeria]MDK7352171.1 hypothetical protein [Rothia aeria]
MFHSPRQAGLRREKTAKSAGAMGQKNDEIYLMVKKPHAPHHRGCIPQENKDYRPRYGTSSAATAHTMHLESVK